jgi:catechol 2,3-dioxygenase-like lactoylglutathione lyase family enzyme
MPAAFRAGDIFILNARRSAAMPITQMQHYMVLSKDLEKTRAFYCDVLGLRTGPRPPFDFEGLWIYVGDVAAVHVATQSSYAETGRLGEAAGNRHGSGSVDHIAFAANNYDELIASFKKHGVQYRATQVPDSDLRQLFVFDPDGIQIEINIRASSSG